MTRVIVSRATSYVSECDSRPFRFVIKDRGEIARRLRPYAIAILHWAYRVTHWSSRLLHGASKSSRHVWMTSEMKRRGVAFHEVFTRRAANASYFDTLFTQRVIWFCPIMCSRGNLNKSRVIKRRLLRGVTSPSHAEGKLRNRDEL